MAAIIFYLNSFQEFAFSILFVGINFGSKKLILVEAPNPINRFRTEEIGLELLLRGCVLIQIYFKT